VSYPIDRAVLDLRLSRDLQHGSQPGEPSAAAMAEMEAGFDESVQHMAVLDIEYCESSKACKSWNESQPQKATFCQTY